MRNSFRRIAVLSALSLFVAMIFTYAPASAEAAVHQKNCSDILALNPAAPDGEYMIEPAPCQVFPVYCYDMAGGSPREYLTLLKTGGSYNFSQFTPGGYWPDSLVKTSFNKIRLDPATLTVDIDDLTFATSTSTQWPGAWLAYATAADCVWLSSHTGIGNIDLTGTPFVVNNAFYVDGWYPAGSVTVDGQVYNLTGAGASVFVTGKIVDLTGGGYAGAIGPVGPNSNFTTWVQGALPHSIPALKLKYATTKTPPEAAIGFDAASKDLKVYDSETGAEASYIVLPSNREKEDGEDEDGEHDKGDEFQAELRQYTLPDCADNSLVLTLRYKREEKEIRIAVIGMQYNNGPSLTAVKNKIQVEFEQGKDGAIKELEQKVAAKKQFEVEAEYRAVKNETRIEVTGHGQPEKKEAKAGMAILELLTDKGGLAYRY